MRWRSDSCMLNCPLRTPGISMALLDDCNLLFMVLVMRRRSGKSVCRNTLKLTGVLVDDRILVSSRMLRKTSGVLGLLENLAWMRAKLDGEFDMTTTIVGHSAGADVVSEREHLEHNYQSDERRLGV